MANCRLNRVRYNLVSVEALSAWVMFLLNSAFIWFIEEPPVTGREQVD
jgi:hypothetical protein